MFFFVFLSLKSKKVTCKLFITQKIKKLHIFFRMQKIKYDMELFERKKLHVTVFWNTSNKKLHVFFLEHNKKKLDVNFQKLSN